MQSLLPESRRDSQNNMLFFVVMIMAFFMLHAYFFPPIPPQQNIDEVVQQQGSERTDDAEADGTERPEPSESAIVAADMEEIATVPTFVTLGSMDPGSPYRSLVTLTNKGAAVSRIELNEPKYREVQDLTGYLGQIVADLGELPQETPGCPVQVVGPGTPAAGTPERPGLKVGDVIVGLVRNPGKTPQVSVDSFQTLRNLLLQTRPGDRIELEVHRDGEAENPKLLIELGQAPINIVRPIGTITTWEQYHDLRGLHGYDETLHDQLSYLCTLSTINEHKLALPRPQDKNFPKYDGIVLKDLTLDEELPGVELRHGLWELVRQSENEAVFRKTIPRWKLEVCKTFRVAEKSNDPTVPFGVGYHLNVSIEIRNLDSRPHTVAYMLDGPTGMPLEGGWYPRKTGPGWSGYGIRDIVVKFQSGKADTIGNAVVAGDKFSREPWKDDVLEYIGVDTQYFQSTLLPVEETPKDLWHSRTLPVRVGEHNTAWFCLTNITFRTYGTEQTLQPGASETPAPDSVLSRTYTVFAGPKNPGILAVYGLAGTISYGWFWFVAIPCLAFLHFLKTYVVFHYGLAIIVLTICVRLLMFPMSKKMVVNAAKNAALMPEMQKIKEKYKGNLEAQSKAQQELWKKHKFNPLSGCLGIFIQIPIFIGLYKSLSIDVELYGAPLISSAFWCNDLSAPDMLFDWSGFWAWLGWTSFSTGQGILTLGPYFNILPMLTVALFIIQQKVMMPPATDDMMRMQQTMMKYMMIFMGLLFFKIPSGLCVYFVASTLWGLAERKLIPKQEFKLDESTGEPAISEKTPEKPVKEKRQSPPEKEQTGTFGGMWKKLTEKAAQPRTLHKSDPAMPKSGKKKKRK